MASNRPEEQPVAPERRPGVKQAARDFYRAGRITLSMALWAMKNAGFSKDETAEWLELKNGGEEQ
jgi:hypothetical protein